MNVELVAAVGPAGTGPEEAAIEQLAARDERIHHEPGLDEPQRRQGQASSVATVVPERSGRPAVDLNSLAAGTPILHAGQGRLPERAPSGERGWRLPADPEDWPATIGQLPVAKLAAMGPACRGAAEQACGRERTIGAHEQTLVTIAGGT